MKKAVLEAEKLKLKFSITKDGNHYLEFESPIGISIGGFNHYQGEFKSTMELYITQGDIRQIKKPTLAFAQKRVLAINRGQELFEILVPDFF